VSIQPLFIIGIQYRIIQSFSNKLKLTGFELRNSKYCETSQKTRFFTFDIKINFKEMSRDSGGTIQFEIQNIQEIIADLRIGFVSSDLASFGPVDS
jgi:hypothetical protein